jgi:hypothetical protein
MTRAQIQDQIRLFAQTMTTQSEVQQAMHDWIDTQTLTDIDKTQIMKDLTGYEEYNDLK